MTTTFNLTARSHESRVLGSWLNGRDGGRERAGVMAATENGVEVGLTVGELTRAIGAMGSSSSGVNVTADLALRESTVYGCVSLISGAIMTLPLAIYQRVGDGQGSEARQPAKHDYWWMLNEQANESMSAATAWEYVVAARLFYGDGFAELLRPSNYSNRVIGWQPHHPLRVQPFRDERTGEVLYRIFPERGPSYVRFAADMIHLPSLGFDGLTSPSPITYAARNAVGTAVAASNYAGRFFAGGAAFDYALTTPNTVNKAQLTDLRESYIGQMQNGGRGPLILTGGMAPAQLTVNSKDAEILATRKFGVEEICRVLGVPPFMVGHTEKTTSFGSGVAEMGVGFVRYVLRRQLTLIAQEFNRKLWPTRERFFVEHDTTELERGDLGSRFTAYRIAAGRAGEPGWMSVNEIRRRENLPPIEGGDALNQGMPNEEPTPATA